MFQKKSYLLVLTVLMLAIASCGDDDTNTGLDLQTVDPDPTEEAELDPALVSNGLIIGCGTKETGNPPTPTGNLPFTLDYTTQSGFLINGFTITYEYDSNYTGAYIQIVGTDGTPSPDYWNVNLTPTNTCSNNKRTTSGKKKLIDDKSTINYDQEINVNFGETIPPGKFCYVMYVYDTVGNISQPQQVCLKVEAWGGNPNLVGTWNYTKEVVDGIITPIGEINFCEGPREITCENQNTLNIPDEEAYCYATSEIILEIKADGTFVFKITDLRKQSFDYNATRLTCSIVNGPYENSLGSVTINNGYWAYNEESGYLNLIDFQYEDLDYDLDNYGYTWDYAFGYLSTYSGEVSFSNSELIIDLGDWEYGDTQFYYTK